MGAQLKKALEMQLTCLSHSCQKHIDIPQGVNGNFKAKCKRYTAIISALTKASSNLLRHLLVCIFSFCLKKVKHDGVI